MIGSTISHYKVLSELGRGGMGVVYKALDLNLDREVALKFLPDQYAGELGAKERFILEAKAASSLDHPNICTIYEIADVEGGSDTRVSTESKNRTFIAMACYQGRTLREKLNDGPVSVTEATNIAAQVLKGLSKAHEAGIIHRDIKPANIMVTDEGTVKILDFGVAKLGDGIDLTRDGSTVGTVAYMSPEQARGEDASVQTDLWAVGVILYEMLSGVQPFASQYEQATVYSIINEEHASLNEGEIPESLKEVVDQLLSKDAASRFASATAAIEALRLSRGGPAATEPVAKSIPIRTIMLGALAVLAAVIAALLLNRETSAPLIESDGLDIVAVIPFKATSDDGLILDGEGIAVMLGGVLDRISSLRVKDPNLIAGILDNRPDWNSNISSGMELAETFGATFFVLGTISPVAGENHISSTLYRANGELMTHVTAEISATEDVFAAVDALGLRLTNDYVAKTEGVRWSDPVTMTESAEAFKAFIESRKALRQFREEEALALARKAVELDSTFAMGWLAVVRAAGWNPAGIPIQNHARAMADRYPEKIPDYVLAERPLPGETQMQLIQRFKNELKKNPDNKILHGRIGDLIHHFYAFNNLPVDEAVFHFEELISAWPEHQEYSGHLRTLYLQQRAFDKVDSLIEKMRPFNPSKADNWELAMSVIRAPRDQQSMMLESVAESHPIETINVIYHIMSEGGIAPPDPSPKMFELVPAIAYEFMFEMGQYDERAKQELLTSEYSGKPVKWASHFYYCAVRQAMLSAEECRALDDRFATASGFPRVYWEGQFDDEQHELLLYFRGLLNWGEQQRDLDKMATILDELEALIPVESPEESVAWSLAARIRGMMFHAQGKWEESLYWMEQGTKRELGHIGFATKVDLAPIERLVHADVLRKLGRTEDAIPIIRSSLSGFFMWRSTTVRAHKMMGELQEEAGNREEAIRNYQEFLNWREDAHESMQDEVQEVRDRLSKLVVQAN